jgi:hypothetical protein
LSIKIPERLVAAARRRNRACITDAEGGASNPELFSALGALARSSRRWAHYTELLVIEAWFLVFYVVHAAGITLPMFIGYGSMPQLGFSLALSHLGMGS